MRGLFVTGADTGVGKTFVTAAIVRVLRRQGRSVQVSKPVATGADTLSEDTRLLAEAAGLSGQREWQAITPWVFTEPTAPPVAARAAGVRLVLKELVEAARCQATAGGILLVEGVGGLLCPLTEQETVADLVRELGLPLVIVARRSLGTLNHTLLTVEAARQRGLRLAGVVVSETAPPQGLAEETNVEELRKRLAIPVLGVLAHGDVQGHSLADVHWWELGEAIG